MQLDRQWFEDWRPKRTDHDAGINVLVRLPTLPEVVGTQTGIGRLQRFGYGHKEPDRFRLVGLGKEVVELADEIHPIHRSPTPVLMIAAIQNNLQLIPSRGEILVGSRHYRQLRPAHPGSRRLTEQSPPEWCCTSYGNRRLSLRGRGHVLPVHIAASSPTFSQAARAVRSKPC